MGFSLSRVKPVPAQEPPKGNDPTHSRVSRYGVLASFEELVSVILLAREG